MANTFCLGASDCEKVNCPLKKAVELNCGACLFKPALYEHSHRWDDGKEFTHTHRKGDRPHGHHGARYIKKETVSAQAG